MLVAFQVGIFALIMLRAKSAKQSSMNQWLESLH
jgi:hypothetical protein